MPWWLSTESCSRETGREDSGNEAERDSDTRKNAKRRRYGGSHHHRLERCIFIPQIKEASEIWWFGGLCPELFIRVRFVSIMDLRSYFQPSIAARVLKKGRKRMEVRDKTVDSRQTGGFLSRPTRISLRPTEQEADGNSVHSRGPSGPVL